MNEKVTQKQTASAKVSAENSYVEVAQNSTVNKFYGNAMIEMADIGNYEAVQDLYARTMREVSSRHPLKEHFNVVPQTWGLAEIEPILISAPKTKEALEMYPKRVEAVGKIDEAEYPGRGADETPVEYGYRLQKEVKVQITEVTKEMLGDTEDPYPFFKQFLKDNNNTTFAVFSPPPFPAAQDAFFNCGGQTYHTKLRVQTSESYDNFIISNIEDFDSLKIVVTFDNARKTTSIRTSREASNNLDDVLNREKFLFQIAQGHPISAYVGDKKILDGIQTKNTVGTGKSNIEFIEYLIAISKHYGCGFDLKRELTAVDYHNAALLANKLEDRGVSLQENWVKISCTTKGIAKEVIETTGGGTFIGGGLNGEFCILGTAFEYDELKYSYENARISNKKTVIRAIENADEKVELSFKPKSGANSITCKYFLCDARLKP